MSRFCHSILCPCTKAHVLSYPTACAAPPRTNQHSTAASRADSSFSHMRLRGQTTITRKSYVLYRAAPSLLLPMTTTLNVAELSISNSTSHCHNHQVPAACPPTQAQLLSRAVLQLQSSAARGHQSRQVQRNMQGGQNAARRCRQCTCPRIGATHT